MDGVRNAALGLVRGSLRAGLYGRSAALLSLEWACPSFARAPCRASRTDPL